MNTNTLREIHTIQKSNSIKAQILIKMTYKKYKSLEMHKFVEIPLVCSQQTIKHQVYKKHNYG